MSDKLIDKRTRRGKEHPPYPVFLRFAGRKALVIGGGQVATRKINDLLTAGLHVTVLSPEVTKEIRNEKRVRWLEGRFPEQAPLLIDFDIVIAATNHRLVNQAVGKACHHRHILTNIVDDPEASDFMNGSVVRIEELGITLSITSGGQSPALVKELREALETSARDFVCRKQEGRVNPD